MVSAFLRVLLVLIIVSALVLIYILATAGVGAFFKALGIILVLFIVLAFVVLIALRLLINTVAKKLVGALAGMQHPGTPRRIQLVPKPDLAWSDPAAVQQQTDDFLRLGFAEAGTFEIEQIPNMKLRGFCLASESIHGVLYESADSGVWSDLICYVNDGRQWLHYTYTNSPSEHLGVLKKPPHSVNVRAPGVELSKLLQRLIKERMAGERREVTVGDFKTRFETAWAEEIDWRNSQGGPTEDEVRAIAGIGGNVPKDDVLEIAREQLTVKALEQLEESLLENFVAQHPATVATELVAIHDRLRPKDVARKLRHPSTHGIVPDVLEEKGVKDLPPGMPRVVFAAVNQERPVESRFTWLGAIEKPISADVYRLPPEFMRAADDSGRG